MTFFGLRIDKTFFQEWDGKSGHLVAEIWNESNDKPEDIFLNADQALKFQKLMQPICA